MQSAGGLTPFTWVFMLLSMGSVTGLMIWCFYRILSTSPNATGREAPGEPGGARP